MNNKKSLMKVYLDNCCYSRPYDGQHQIKIQLETKAKLFMQYLIKSRKIKLVTSFVLMEEISASSDNEKIQTIMKFINKYASIFVGAENIENLNPIIIHIMETGIKTKDAVHIASAILANCDYFISTDKRLLQYKNDKIKLLNPVDFKKIWEGINDD